MGYPLGSVDLRNKEGCLELEARGDGIEFTLIDYGPNQEIILHRVFKLTDDAVRELIDRLQLGLSLTT